MNMDKKKKPIKKERSVEETVDLTREIDDENDSVFLVSVEEPPSLAYEMDMEEFIGYSVITKKDAPDYYNNNNKVIEICPSNDDTTFSKNPTNPEYNQKKKKRKRRGEIECPFCDFKTRFKGQYQKHSIDVHNRQRLICDGCNKTSHLIYVLLKHRTIKHGFTHEYSAVAVPM